MNYDSTPNSHTCSHVSTISCRVSETWHIFIPPSETCQLSISVSLSRSPYVSICSTHDMEQEDYELTSFFLEGAQKQKQKNVRKKSFYLYSFSIYISFLSLQLFNLYFFSIFIAFQSIFRFYLQLFNLYLFSIFIAFQSISIFYLYNFSIDRYFFCIYIYFLNYQGCFYLHLGRAVVVVQWSECSPSRQLMIDQIPLKSTNSFICKIF